MERSGSPRETGHGEVEAAPKEMNGARLAQEAGSKKLEYAIDLDKHTPKAMGGGGVVGGVGPILRKWVGSGTSFGISWIAIPTSMPFKRSMMRR